MASCIGREQAAPANGTIVEQKTQTRADPARKTGNEPADTEVRISLPANPAVPEEPMTRTRCTPIIFEALEMLRRYGFEPVRVSEPILPVNIIAMKKSGSLLIWAFRPRFAVPDAATLRERYSRNVEYLCGLAGRVTERVLIWIFFPSTGWRHYLVYPGGLRRDLDFPKSL